MPKYHIHYNTGAGDFTVSGTLEQAMQQADAGAAYTQQDITISDNHGNIIARRPWYGTLTGIDDQSDPIQFGDFGFFADWYTV